jgi:CelD/BcsL family acetyltransferase involved in cellulose biosynthesis
MSNAGSGIGTDHAGWLADDRAEEMVTTWLVEQRPALLKGISLAAGESIGGRVMEIQRCPRVMVSDVPTRMSSKLAKTLRNARRRLADDGVGFEWKPPGAVTPDDLERLYDLHRLRRSETGDEPIFDDPLRRSFHERLLAKGDTAGGTAILAAARDGEVVGILYGFLWQKTFAYYQIGWDPSYRQRSLGSVLVLEAIEACSGQGVEVFDFLRGADDYKYRFGATDVVEGSFAIGRSAGLTGIGALNRLRGKPRSVQA